MARFYINRFGRFSCVDPALGSPGDPQSWNRYAYARNDPVNITDPSGQFWFFKLIGALLAIFGVLTGQPELVQLGMRIAGAWGPLNIGGGFPGTPPTFPDPLGNTQATLNSIYHPMDPSKFGTPPFFDPATGSMTDALQKQLKDALNGLAGRCKSVLPYTKMQDTVEKLQFYDARPKSSDSGLYADYIQPGAVHKTIGDLMGPGIAAMVLPYKDKEGNLQRSPNILIGKYWGMFGDSVDNATLVHEESHYVMQLDDNGLWAFAQKNGANPKQGGQNPSGEYTWWIQRGCPDEQGGAK